LFPGAGFVELVLRAGDEVGCTVIEESPEIPRCYIKDPYGMIFNVGQSSSEE